MPEFFRKVREKLFTEGKLDKYFIHCRQKPITPYTLYVGQAKK